MLLGVIKSALEHRNNNCLTTTNTCMMRLSLLLESRKRNRARLLMAEGMANTSITVHCTLYTSLDLHKEAKQLSNFLYSAPLPAFWRLALALDLANVAYQSTQSGPSLNLSNSRKTPGNLVQKRWVTREACVREVPHLANALPTFLLTPRIPLGAPLSQICLQMLKECEDCLLVVRHARVSPNECFSVLAHSGASDLAILPM